MCCRKQFCTLTSSFFIGPCLGWKTIPEYHGTVSQAKGACGSIPDVFLSEIFVMPFAFIFQAQGRPPLMGACCSEVEAAPGSAAAKTMPAPLPVASPYRMEGGRRHQFFLSAKNAVVSIVLIFLFLGHRSFSHHSLQGICVRVEIGTDGLHPMAPFLSTIWGSLPG